MEEANPETIQKKLDTMRVQFFGLCKSVDTMRRMTLGKSRNGHYEVSVGEYENVVTKAGAHMAIMLKEDADEQEVQEVLKLAKQDQEGEDDGQGTDSECSSESVPEGSETEEG